jgi:folate-dependent phosphoribosylglycinamide formyltransferase PurN
MQDRCASETGLMTTGPANDTALDRSIRVVVFTSGPALEDGLRELLYRIESHPDIALMGVIWESEGTTLSDAWRDLRRRRGVLAPVLFALEMTRRTRRWLRSARQRQSGAVLSRIEDRVHVVADMHADPVLEEIRALAPDLGLSYGSPILRPALFQIPSRGTLGIHHGKLPEYRGKKTPFWAIYSGEAYAGVTIQRVNARLDAGEIVREGEVRIGRRTLGAVWRRLEALGVTLYMQAILAIRDGCADLEPPRGEKGPLYRDPTPRDIAIFWLRWLLRLARGRPRETAS